MGNLHTATAVLSVGAALVSASAAAAVPLKLIQLRSASSPADYVTAYWPDGAVRVDSVAYTHASTFELHLINDNQWQLRAMKNNLYVSCENGGGSSCDASREEASGWETFNVTTLSNNQVQLQSSSGNWLGVQGGSSSLVAAASTPTATETFHMEEIAQQRAVNLGSWLVPEKWMFSGESALWADTAATDLYTLMVELGPEEASKRMHDHWAGWFVEADFQRMADMGVNHVRLPMGYWDMIETYPFVFGGADYIDKAVNWSARYGMTVLIDLHGAPGSQNGNDHSGQSGDINWPLPENVAETVVVLGMMADRWANVKNVWGFELLNEPGADISHDLLTSFYRDGYAAIREHSDTSHVVINSLYGPHDWTASVLPEPEYRNAVLDLHLYVVWSGYSTVDESFQGAVEMGEEIRRLTPYYPVIVGEMSLATGIAGYTNEDRQVFADTEFTSFTENAYGFIFWSDKLEYVSDDWAFVDGFSYVKDYYLPTR
jgi:hypothetical protein